MIVNYGDFTFVKDDGYLALAHTAGEGEPEVITRIHVGDSLADLVGKAWVHREAPDGVVKAVSER